MNEIGVINSIQVPEGYEEIAIKTAIKEPRAAVHKYLIARKEKREGRKH